MCVVTRSPCGNPAASHSLCVSARPVGETSHIATLQPSATSWRTSSRPIPLPPPVTTAILPAKSFMMSYLPLDAEQPTAEALSVKLVRHATGVVGVEGGVIGPRRARAAQDPDHRV